MAIMDVIAELVVMGDLWTTRTSERDRLFYTVLSCFQGFFVDTLQKKTLRCYLFSFVF